MPITPTYPGLYIEELPSSSHTITAAPTSVAVFVGYSHPFKTQTFNQPVEIFSFSDYERLFGGFFNSSLFAGDQQAGLMGDLAMAVYQFFQNGGADAFVVGLQAQLPLGSPPPSPLDDLTPVQGQAVATIENANFEALEFVDDQYQLRITVENIVPVSSSQTWLTADLTISYLPTAANSNTNARVVTETYPRVNFAPQAQSSSSPVSNPNSVVARIAGVSKLVNVALDPSVAVPTTAWAAAPFDVFFGPALPAPTTVAPGSTHGNIFNPGDYTNALAADSPLDKLPIFNLLILPGVTASGVLSAASAFCQLKRAFLIMDPLPGDSADGSNGTTAITTGFSTMPKSKNSAVYFPYLMSNDPLTGAVLQIPPSGTVAGIFAEIDTNRGVWKAPAGLETTLTNVTDVVPTGQMTDQRQGVLNQAGINCIRNFPGVGPVVFGARTSVASNPSFQEWKYVPVRRMALFLEQTLYANLGWVVFEPNDEPLWNAIKATIEAFMLGLFRQGAFQGETPSDAFQVKCDSQTTTQADIDNGIVNIVVAFAPLKPAEFVIIQIAQLAGQTQ